MKKRLFLLVMVSLCFLHCFGMKKVVDKDFLSPKIMLLQAIIYDDLNGVKKLMRDFVKDINARVESFEGSNTTFLLYACALGRYQIVKWLISQGANVNLCAKNKGLLVQQTPLTAAIMSLKFVCNNQGDQMVEKKPEDLVRQLAIIRFLLLQKDIDVSIPGIRRNQFFGLVYTCPRFLLKEAIGYLENKQKTYKDIKQEYIDELYMFSDKIKQKESN